MNHNLYAILEIDANADQDTLESAYRRLALRFHPDLNHSPDANLRMQDINVAYSILRHPQKRAEYDRQFRHTAPLRHAQPAPAPRRPSPPPPVRYAQRPAPHQTPTAPAPALAEQVIIFYLDDTAYAFSIPEIETVLMAKNILPQENCPRFVEGILEVRRSFVPVIDLCRHIGVPSRRGADARVILANLHGERLGLLVDSVENYVVVPTGAIKFPRSLGSMDVPFIRGFARVGFQVVILLNLAGLFTSEQEEIFLKYCQTLHTLSPCVHAR